MAWGRSSLDWTVAQRLAAANHRWKVLLMIQLLCGWIILFTLTLMGVGWSIHRHWLSRTVPIALFYVFIVLVFMVGFALIILAATMQKRSNSWLAMQIEKHFPHLLDRLNTLAHLETRPRGVTTEAYFKAIGLQAGNELHHHSAERAISPRTTILIALAALAACVGTVAFYRHFQPWATYAQDKQQGSAPDDSQNAQELRLPEDKATKEKKAWGEVRITEPGGDLKLTKVDVLPLTVEAASSERLKNADWSTSLNGGAPAQHPLAAPEEPNYAVYQPTIYLDELAVSDWDVLSYFARAATEGDGKYASQIYFVEIKPFREDILKMEAKDGGGKGMAELQELSLLIQKQQEILRQTYRQNEQPSSTKAEQKQDQEKLGAAQGDLKDATAHLYAKIAASENQDVGTVLDKLAEAQGSMEHAVGKLKEPDNPAALGKEQTALQQLVESRKNLVKSISEGKGSGDSQSGENEDTPIAGQKKDKDRLADIEDIRDQGKAALNAVKAAQEKQQAIAQETAAATAEKLPDLAKRQEQLNKELADFQEKVPRPFEGLKDQSLAAKEAMDKAVPALAKRSTGKPATLAAKEAIADLQKGLENQAAQRSLGDVYKMKDMLDARADDLGEMEKNPENFKASDLAKAAAQAKATKDAMAKTLNDTQAGQAFGPGLKDALEGEPGKQLDQSAEQAQKQADANPSAQSGGASPALTSLKAIQDAFTTSQPAIFQGKTGPAQAGGGSSEGGVAEAERSLNSLIQRMKEGHETKPEDLKKQLEEAQYALLEEAKDHPSDAAPLLAMADNLSKLSGQVDLNVDADALRKLVDRLEAYRLEMADHQRTTPDDPKLLHVDPSKVPTEFRERVRRYFEKLSDG